MFCSEDCRTRAFRRYHEYECPVMESLLKSGSVHMSIRIFFIALSIFDGSLADLKTFSEEIKSSKSTVFDIDFSNEKEKDKKMLQALLSLTRSSKSFPLQMHEEILKNHPTVGCFWDENEEFIKNFLLQSCQISDLNFHGIFSGSSQKVDLNPAAVFNTMQQSIGSGSMPFCSLLNHSCANNVLRVCVEGKIVLVVCRPIAKDSQLFDCYK
jgi:SET and MYND domain-containing protein 4